MAAKKSVPEKIIPAFTLIRAEGGWSFVELQLDQDYNVIDYKATQPDMKPIAQEAFKIAVGKYWLKLEG